MNHVMTRTRDGGWMPLAISLAIQAMVAMALMTVPAIVPSVAEGLGISPAYLGVYVAVGYFAAVLASLAAGGATERFGSIRTSQFGLVLCAAGLALCASGYVAAVAIGAVLVGFGYGPITPASSHLLTRTTPAHRMSLVFSIKQTGVPLGVAMAGGIAPSLQQWWGWQWALIAVAAACVACALLAQSLRSEFDHDRNPDTSLRVGTVLDPVRMVLRDHGLRMLALCSFAFAMAQLSLTAYAVIYLTDSLAYGLIAAGAVLAVSQVGGILGRVGWGYASDRWIGARRTLAILAVLMALSAFATACLFQGAPHWLVAGVLFIFGISAIGWNGVYLAEVARQAPPGKAGLATGGTLAITFMGNVLGPVMFGALAGAFQSYRAGFVGLALVLVLCAVMLVRWAMAESSGAGKRPYQADESQGG